MSAVTETAVRFPSAGTERLMLEGILTRPEESGADAAEGEHPVAVLCHPQPISSSMDDGFTRQVARDLAAEGFVTLRFNFRSVGSSEGASTDGRLEPLDVAGAVAFALAQPGVNARKLALVGHAFGAYVALVYAAADARVRTVVAVSLPVFRITPELARFERPRLFVTGEYDEVSPRHKLIPWLEELPGARNLRVISGAGHLLRGSEATASATVVRYLVQWAATPGV